MIEIELDINYKSIYNNIEFLKKRLIKQISLNKDIHKILKESIKNNIDRQKTSKDSTYRKRELRNGKKYWMSNLPHKPIETIKPVIDRSKILGRYNEQESSIYFSFQYDKKDSRKYLIHNSGGITYNPRSKDKKSIIPNREHLYLNRFYKEKLLNEIRKYGIT